MNVMGQRRGGEKEDDKVDETDEFTILPKFNLSLNFLQVSVLITVSTRGPSPSPTPRLLQGQGFSLIYNGREEAPGSRNII